MPPTLTPAVKRPRIALTHFVPPRYRVAWLIGVSLREHRGAGMPDGTSPRTSGPLGTDTPRGPFSFGRDKRQARREVNELRPLLWRLPTKAATSRISSLDRASACGTTKPLRTPRKIQSFRGIFYFNPGWRGVELGRFSVLAGTFAGMFFKLTPTPRVGVPR